MTDLLKIVSDAPAAELPRLLGQLREAEAVAWLRLQSAPQSHSHLPSSERLLDVKETAERLGCSPDWLYRHADQLPFTRRHGYGLRFLESGLDAYLRRK